MTEWEYCSIYQITQNGGWLTGVGMAYKSSFTEQGAKRQTLEHDPDALA